MNPVAGKRQKYLKDLKALSKIFQVHPVPQGRHLLRSVWLWHCSPSGSDSPRCLGRSMRSQVFDCILNTDIQIYTGYTTSNCSICNCSMQTSTASLRASHLGPCKCDSRRIVRLSSQHLPRARAAANVSLNVHEWNVMSMNKRDWRITIPMEPSWNIETGPASRSSKHSNNGTKFIKLTKQLVERASSVKSEQLTAAWTPAP